MNRYCGILGKVARCQVGVFLAHVGPRGRALVDKRLYLPPEWAHDPARCAAAGFPTTCQDCHTTSGWTGASFNHTWFSIPHHSAQCSDCHTNASAYSTFVCTNCHGQSNTNSQHSGVNGYVYNSTNCYGCHRS